MERRATWRALAVTYAVVAGIQLYLAIVMGVVWAWVLTVVGAMIAVGCAIAAARRPDRVESASRPDVAEDPLRTTL